MKIKPDQILFECHPLSNTSDIVIREQELGHHRLSDTPYRNPDMVISERGSNCHRLSDELHQHLNVVPNEKDLHTLLGKCEEQGS
jgi:hypothetical protein